jgi:hypothetical protein
VIKDRDASSHLGGTGEVVEEPVNPTDPRLVLDVLKRHTTNEMGDVGTDHKQPDQGSWNVGNPFAVTRQSFS